MKIKLLLILLIISQVGVAQMSTSTTGNIVTFTFDDNIAVDWDANGNPVNLYAFVDAADAGNNMFAELSNGFPGTNMVNQGGDIYTVSFDLSTFYPEGTSITDIRYIYTNDSGNQNPAGFGNSFSAVNRSGFIPFTTLSSDNLKLNNINIVTYVKNRELNINSTIDVNSVKIYNLLGQSVFSKNYENQRNILVNMETEATGIYIVKINSDNKSITKKNYSELIS
ncbi:hypothetical protein BTO05_13660 [Winogradskyella sp. PC-19]|uniref:T9SS type A sorting domain-containing protein n=1 Tax=unclassified Winogradskyella TaxID=2615021 RepID=UPI000B3CF0A1|nr:MULTISPECIES: T9SS type A sorting domain-containing protein [unclassified Winogradskyella]ARV10630.1 hypothetical protein BTO05_13660 [Winogradskyella sp. PC-19]RZN81001.1 MAG: T9SS type A sorting domain-containing protein [Winogradskyella sp.]